MAAHDRAAASASGAQAQAATTPSTQRMAGEQEETRLAFAARIAAHLGSHPEPLNGRIRASVSYFLKINPGDAAEVYSRAMRHAFSLTRGEGALLTSDQFVGCCKAVAAAFVGFSGQHRELVEQLLRDGIQHCLRPDLPRGAKENKRRRAPPPGKAMVLATAAHCPLPRAPLPRAPDPAAYLPQSLRQLKSPPPSGAPCCRAELCPFLSRGLVHLVSKLPRDSCASVLARLTEVTRQLAIDIEDMVRGGEEHRWACTAPPALRPIPPDAGPQRRPHPTAAARAWPFTPFPFPIAAGLGGALPLLLFP